jgi:hypothetical protein
MLSVHVVNSCFFTVSFSALLSSSVCVSLYAKPISAYHWCRSVLYIQESASSSSPVLVRSRHGAAGRARDDHHEYHFGLAG